MRIAIVNYTRRREGGAEAYVADLLPRFASAGHELALWSECDQPQDKAHFDLPAGTVAWCASERGTDRALDALRAWKPDVVLGQGILDARVELVAPTIAPGAFVAHNYHATCVSGLKSFRVPDERPCDRAFGPACLALYFPRRCGGLNPRTMLSLYGEVSTRRQAIARYPAVVTLSAHMREEMVRNGFAGDRVHHVPFLAPTTDAAPAGERAAAPERVELLFLGRLARNKGGHVLLDALPAVRAALGRPVRLAFAGTGTEEHAWREQAARIARRTKGVTVDFLGWLGRDAIDEALGRAHLLVAPSVWPEPLGLVGIEAGRAGVPAVSFDVGGVREWLHPGVSGELAPGGPPTVDELAAAICRALIDDGRYARLRAGARWVASRWDPAFHARGVLALLESVAGRST